MGREEGHEGGADVAGEVRKEKGDLELGPCSQAPKSLQMVTTAMKLKDAYSLEGKL